MEILLSLPFLVFLPMFISFLVISPLFTSNEIVIRRFVKSVCGFHFVYTLIMLVFFSSANPYSSTIKFLGLDWVQSLGIKCSFQVDSVSMILVTLTSFIFFIASVSSKFNVRKNHKFYYSMFLLLMSSILGIFTSNDMFLFFLFWELEMVPAYFLIGTSWNNNSEEEVENAKKSAIKFILYTFLGSMFMLLGILLIHYYNFVSTGFLSASFGDISLSEVPHSIQLLITICLLIGFGVKLPIVPLHAWLPDAHTNAITPVSMILAGILLKTGGYGIYKFNYSTLPEAFHMVIPVLGLLAIINIIYIAFVTYAQTDIKRIIAYSSISNMGLVLLGLCSLNHIGLSASVFHMVSHGLVTCGLFMIAGIVYLRYKNRDINTLSGIASQMPRLYGFAVLIVLASVGVPMFAPFISEVLTMIGALNSEFSETIKFAGIFSLPLLIMSSCYMLKFLHNGFFGRTLESCANGINSEAKINDITLHEFIVLASIIVGLLIFGIFPNIMLSMIG